MKPVADMTQSELAAFVQTHLEREGVHVVLSGGAAVATYTRGDYVTQDIDLINVYDAAPRAIRLAMLAIGFREEARYFRHPDSPHVVEFPPGPLTIGRHPVGRVEEIQLATGRLHIISPTDCVKDRLAAYFHWGDLQSLHQALQVARRRKINLEEVRTWSRAEGKLREFETFCARLKAETD